RGALRARDRHRPRTDRRRGYAGGAGGARRPAPAGGAACRGSPRRGADGAGGAARRPSPRGGAGSLRAPRSERRRSRSPRPRGGAACWPRPARAAPGTPGPGGGLPPSGPRRGARLVSVFAIAGKELALYFTSLVFYAIATVFLVLSGYLFYTNLDFYVRFG